MKRLHSLLLFSFFTAALCFFSPQASASDDGLSIDDSSLSASTKTKGKELAELMNKLNLTTEQQEMIKDHSKRYYEERRLLVSRIREKQAELKTELESMETSRTKIDSLIHQINQLNASLTRSKVEGILAIKEVLNVDQYALLLKMQGENAMVKSK